MPHPAEGAADSRTRRPPELTKAERLRQFRGELGRHDRESVEHWRNASPAQHAAAMIELSEYAETMAAYTGIHKNVSETFPGFPRPRQRADEPKRV